MRKEAHQELESLGSLKVISEALLPANWTDGTNFLISLSICASLLTTSEAGSSVSEVDGSNSPLPLRKTRVLRVMPIASPSVYQTV